MNLIQLQAKEFYRDNYGGLKSDKEFIQSLRWELDEYRKYPHKLEFLEEIILLLRKDYDNHLTSCRYRDKNRLDCKDNKSFENCLFFAQNEKDELISMLEPEDFSPNDKQTIVSTLDKILTELNALKLGQEITYDDLQKEFDDLKDYFFIDKKRWNQLFIGKILEMTAAGIVSETLSKEIVEVVKKNYDTLL